MDLTPAETAALALFAPQDGFADDRTRATTRVSLSASLTDPKASAPIDLTRWAGNSGRAVEGSRTALRALASALMALAHRGLLTVDASPWTSGQEVGAVVSFAPAPAVLTLAKTQALADLEA